MRNGFFFFCLCLCFIFAVLPHGTIYAAASSLEQPSYSIEELFNAVNAVHPSEVSREEHNEIITRRISCFASNFSHLERLKTCVADYLESIVATARVNVNGRPAIGLFLKNVSLCPIMYNICAGQMDVKGLESLNTCVTFERQCIDYTLDTFWRGIPIYETLQLRTD